MTRSGETSKRPLAYSEMDEVAMATRQRIIASASSSLRAFTVATMSRFRFSHHHKRLCNALMDWIYGVTPYLIISMPPRNGKTELCSKRTPAFIHGIDPNGGIIAASYGASLASKNNREVQRIIDSDVYRQIFPGTTLQNRRTKLISDTKYLRNSTEYEIVGHRGYYRAAGINGAVTGIGADYLIIDDPIKNHKEADSQVYREANWDWFQATSSTRLEKNAKILVVMTRWHEDDLAGRLLAQAKADPLAYQFKELKMPAIRDDLSDPDDPRKIGEPLWPEKFSLNRLKTIQASMAPRWWNALQQQRPTALEGGIIKGSWIKYYTELPPTWHRQIQSWDMSFKKTEDGSYVVGLVFGVYSGKKYLLDMVRDRMGYVKTEEELLRMASKWPKAYTKLIENKANGPAIEDRLKSKVAGITLVDPDGSKAARLESVSPQFKAGDVLFPHPSIAPWINVVVSELTQFPNAAHNDIPDAMSQALHELGDGSSLLDKLGNM